MRVLVSNHGPSSAARFCSVHLATIVATAAPWITSFPSRTVEAFSVSAILPSPGTLIGPTNILSIEIDVTSHDLVNTMPKGPLNSLHRNPNLKITDASGNIYFDEELGVKAVSKTFDTPLTDDTTGYTATAGDVLTVEVTYLHITSGSPPRTESTTITL